MQMNYTPVSYRTKLKNLSLKHSWINPRLVKPLSGHVDLIARLLALCESAMGSLSPEFSVFQVRYLQNRMKITIIPAPDSACDSLALRQAISLTVNEANIVCPHCGSYQATPQSLEEVYVCCPASGDLVLWEAIPDIMAMQPDERNALFDMVIAEEVSQRPIGTPATK
jgi:hypothetical protein